MQDEITFERMKLSDRDRVLAFLRVAYADAPRQSDAEFWNWHYLDNPNNRSDEIPVWLAKSGDRLVGQLATIPVELNIAGVSEPAIWILDLMVDPEFRRRGIMKKLVLAAQKEYPFMLGSATRKQHSAAMLTGLGWTVFSPIPRYHKLLFPGNASQDLARLGPLRGISNLLFSPFRPRLRGLNKNSAHVRNVEKFDARFDELWNECAPQWGCSISRNSDYLRWQFEQQPNKKFEILGYFYGKKMLGYAVLFFRKASDRGLIDKAAITDICYHPTDPKKVIDALLSASISRAVELKVGGLVTDAMDPMLEERLRRAGFWPVKSGLEIMATGPEHPATIFDPAKWHLTRADSDISIFEDPNL